MKIGAVKICMLNYFIKIFSLSSYFFSLENMLFGNVKEGGGLFLLVLFRDDGMEIHGSIITVINRGVYEDSL